MNASTSRSIACGTIQRRTLRQRIPIASSLGASSLGASALLLGLVAAGCRKDPKAHKSLGTPSAATSESLPTIAAPSLAKKLEGGKLFRVKPNRALAFPPFVKEGEQRWIWTHPAGDLRFASIEGALDAFVAAAGAGDVRAAHVRFTPQGSTASVVPWESYERPPTFALAKNKLVALWDRGAAKGQVWGWQEGAKTKLIARGDQLRLHGFHCSHGACTALTNRISASAASGAHLLRWGPSLSGIKREERSGDWQPAALGPRGSFLSRSTFAWTWRGSAPNSPEQEFEAAKLGRLLAATETAANPLAVFLTDKVDKQGCTHSQAHLQIVLGKRRGGQLLSPQPPVGISLHPVGDDVLAGWIAPTKCNRNQRYTVFMALIDGKTGKIKSSALPVGDGGGFQMASKGREILLLTKQAKGVVLMRGRLSPTK